MPDIKKRRATLEARLQELDARILQIEEELDSHNSKDGKNWPQNAKKTRCWKVWACPHKPKFARSRPPLSEWRLVNTAIVSIVVMSSPKSGWMCCPTRHFAACVQPNTAEHQETSKSGGVDMAFEQLKIALTMLMDEIAKRPEDAHILQEQLREKISEFKTLGLPVPDDIQALEDALEQNPENIIYPKL